MHQLELDALRLQLLAGHAGLMDPIVDQRLVQIGDVAPQGTAQDDMGIRGPVILDEAALPVIRADADEEVVGVVD